jgi:hypothetical protein
MLSPGNIGWGEYNEWEGPFYRGTCPFVLPDKPTREDRIMAVIAACEGGHYDAINMYDSAILSSGLIQWIEAGQFSVSGMLGAVHDARGGSSLSALKPALELADAEFSKRDGKWRFYVGGRSRPSELVDTIDEQRMLFCMGSGEKDTWTASNKLYAKTWAACVAEVWKDPENQAIQHKYTADRLSRFVRPAAHQVFLNMNASGAEPWILEAAYAAYLSFAVNNPTRAEWHLLKVEDGKYGEVYDYKWLNAMLQELTYGPGIAIYPARYHAIRPLLEKFYGLELFEGVGELSDWLLKNPGIAPMSTQQVQEILIKLGYDLGPWGADGRFGRKTKAALYAFQRTQGVGISKEYVNGELNAPTYEALKRFL